MVKVLRGYFSLYVCSLESLEFVGFQNVQRYDKVLRMAHRDWSVFDYR